MNPYFATFRLLSLVILALAALLLAPVRSAVAAGDAERRSPRPSFLLVLMDDVRWDAIGCAPNPIVRTPHIDRLAAGGVRFANAFSTTSICATSRATILTSQYARRHGIHDFNTPLSGAAFSRTFPALLRGAGYRTGFVGKWGLGGALPVEEYDVFEGFSGQGRYFQEGRKGHLTRILEAQALRFLDGCSPGTPFCLQVSFKAAHVQDGDPHPFQPDPRYAKLYEDVEVPRPRTATEDAFRSLPPFLRDSEARRRWHTRFATPELYQRSVKDYYRLITGADEALGSLLARLEDRGLRESTVVVVTSDNGFYLGERGLAGKWFPHEESIRLPLVIQDPRAPAALAGRVIEPMVLTIDLAPTVLDLAGIEAPKAMQGESLARLMAGDGSGWREEWFYEHLFEHKRIPKSEAVRTASWKYIKYIEEPAPDGASGGGGNYEELYDLEKDPLEEKNLARDAAHRDRLLQLRSRWRELRESVR